MGAWTKNKVESSQINGGQEYTKDSNPSLEQLNAITNNSFYAVDKADEALTKANSAFENNGTIVSIANNPVTTLNFDSDPQTEIARLDTKILSVELKVDNDKANKDLSNVTQPTITSNGTFIGNDRVIESFISSDGLTWYRKWASGWKECGMTNQGTSSSGSKQLTLPIGFTTQNVTVTYSATNSSNLLTIKCKMTDTKNEIDNLYYTVNVATGTNSTSYVSSNCSIYCCGY